MLGFYLATLFLVDHLEDMPLNRVATAVYQSDGLSILHLLYRLFIDLSGVL